MRVQKREERFERILDAAETVFLKHGYRRASLEDVASEAGLSKATLYHYVEGKEDLFGEVAMRFHRSIVNAQQKAMDLVPDPVDKLRALARTLVEYHIHVIQVFGNGSGRDGHEAFPIKHRVMREMRERQKELIASVLEAGIRSGAFRALDVHKAAGLLDMVFRGVLLEVCHTGHEPGSVVGAFMDMVLHGIESR